MEFWKKYAFIFWKTKLRRINNRRFTSFKIDVKHESQFYLTIITEEIYKDNKKIYINGEETISPFISILEFLLSN